MKGKVVTEEQLGVSEIVDDLEKSFAISCRMNGYETTDTSPEAVAYHRRYMLTMFAMILSELSAINNKLSKVDEEE